MEFMKWHGLGNDFILLDCREQNIVLTAGAVVAMCDRHVGIGADGVVRILPPRTSEALAAMEIYNADGTIAEMCGNALRCVAKMLARENADTPSLRIDTVAGTLEATLSRMDGEDDVAVRVNMGIPGLRRRDVGIDDDGEALAQSIPIAVDDSVLPFTGVSMGNPHAVTFVTDIDSVPLERWGPQVETASVFRRQTNAEFVEVVPSGLRMRVWERGVGITKACGTGACAAMVAAVQNGLAAARATVLLDGGTLEIEWDGKGYPVYMTGPAVHVYDGVIKSNEGDA